MRLDDKVAIITGAASGIGKEIAIVFARAGAKVVIADLDKKAADATAKEIDPSGKRSLGVAMDVTSEEQVDAGTAEVVKAFGRIDVLVSNAGIQIVHPVEEFPFADWKKMLAIHLDGTFHGTRAAARSMAARETGAIVNVASICGIEGCTGHPHYSAAKGGILAFTRTVAKELIQQNVRVNAVAPGFVDTQLVGGSLSPALIEMIRVQTPQARLGRPEEIAATIVFLAADEASFFVGDTLSPNGGFVTS